MQRILILLLCLNTFGCAANTLYVAKPFVEPQFGMTRQQLIGLLGKPEHIEIYKEPDDTRKEFYFYVRKFAGSSEQVPVGLVNNRVAGWGKAYFQDHVSNEDTRIR